MVKLYNDDCLIGLNNICDKTINMIFADLPYGTTACKWDTIIPLDKLWAQFNRILKQDGIAIFTCSMPFTAILATSNIKMLRYELIWEKPQGTNPMAAKKMPMKSHENILIFYNKFRLYNPQMEKGKPYGGFNSETSKIGEVYGSLKSKHRDNPTGERYPKSILRFKQEKGLHPTQKPVPLLEYLIKTYSNPGDTILDPVMGSGTTGVACINIEREFIGIEKDINYFNVAQKRILDTQRQHQNV